MTDDTTDGDGAEASSSETDGGDELSLDACLELLANRQRRAIVGHFSDGEVGENASVDEIISKIIDLEARKTGERPGHDTVASTLYHVHLPKFAETGVLEYDPRHLEIRYYGNPKIEQVYAKIQELE